MLQNNLKNLKKVWLPVNKIQIPPGKLARLQQWYEKDLELLADERMGMHRCFPGFTEIMLEDGRMAWHGTLNLGLPVRNQINWNLLVVYENDHPQKQMSGSVHVFPLDPDMDTIIDMLGVQPHHILYDPVLGHYLCTAREGDIDASYDIVTTAVQTLTWAVKWLTSFELVLAGVMTIDEFNHGNI